MNLILESECGKYVAISHGSGFDVIASDGSCVWLETRRKYSGFDDPLLKIVEFENEVVGYINRSYTNRAGRHVPYFEIRFADLDTSVEIIEFSGNAIVKEYRAVFNKVRKSLTRQISRSVAVVCMGEGE